MELRKMLKLQIRVPGDKKKEGKNLTSNILDLCRNYDIIGASVIRTIYGYGEHEYQPHILKGVTNLPQVIEVIDTPQKILRILPKLKHLIDEDGLITIEEVLAL